jgi:hypothetical protein
MFVMMDKVLVYLPTKLGFLVLTWCVPPPWVCLDIPSFLAVESARNPLFCWASPCLGAAWSLLPSVPSPLNSAEEACELYFVPEVATLFGKEIRQSNGDILLTICW